MLAVKEAKALRDFLPMNRLCDEHFDIAYVTNTTYGFYSSVPSVPFELTQNTKVSLTQYIFCCPI